MDEAYMRIKRLPFFFMVRWLSHGRADNSKADADDMSEQRRPAAGVRSLTLWRCDTLNLAIL